jgi:hypothetical protein
MARDICLTEVMYARCIFTLMVPCGGKVDATILIARGPMTPGEVVSSVSGSPRRRPVLTSGYGPEPPSKSTTIAKRPLTPPSSRWRTKSEHDVFARARGQRSTCGPRPPSSPCAFKSGKSKAGAGALQRCFPLGSPLWTRGSPGVGSQSAHCMKSLAGEMAPSTEPRLHYSLPASQRAHEERCSGVSLDPISSRQPSRKPA